MTDTTTTTGGILLTSKIIGFMAPGLSELAPLTCLWDQPDPIAFAHSAAGQAIRVIATVGMEPPPPELLDALKGVKAIVCASAGYDGIDIPDCLRRGLIVANTPALNANDVAEYAVGMIIGAVRKIPAYDHIVRSGAWTPTYRGVLGRSLSAKRIGIVGLGAIGSAVARRLEPFGCKIAWWGPRPKQTPFPRVESLEVLAKDSDVLVICALSDATTNNMIDRHILDLLGADGILINVARGALVDEAALREALKSGKLAAAGLDVFVEEPTPASQWKDVPNTILAPHAASFTHEVAAATVDMVKQNVRQALTDGTVLTPIPECVRGK